MGAVYDVELLRAALCGCSAMVHTASLHVPHIGTCGDDEFRSINVEGTRQALAAAAQAGIERVVYTSTTSVYGRAMESSSAAVWVDEELAPEPRDIYDSTKLAAEALCSQWAGHPGRTCLALRMSRCFPEPASDMILYRLYRGVDATDVAQAHALALDAPLEGFDCLNISAQTPFLREDVAELKTNAAAVIEKRCPGVAVHFQAMGWPLPDSIGRVYCIDKARRLLGYAPRHDWRSLVPG